MTATQQIDRLRRLWEGLPFVWKYQVVFWSVYSAGLYPVHFIALRHVYGWQAPLPYMLLVYVINTALIILMTHALAWTMESRLFKRLRVPGIVLWICAGSSLLLMVTKFIILPFVSPLLYRPFGGFRFAVTTGEAGLAHGSYTFVMFAGWAGIFLFAKRATEARRKRRELLEAEAKLREAEILMLRSQLNPHFLFNALNTLAEKADPTPEADHLVEGISDYLRYSLANRTQLFVPLREDLQATRHYLEVNAHRLGNKLDFHIEVPPECLDLDVPGMLLQPLVENSIKYGKEENDVLRIRIRCGYSGGQLEITVSNTGEWISPEPQSSDHIGGVGLSNLRGRLERLYPGRNHVETGSGEGWSNVSITIQPITGNSPDRFPADWDSGG